MKYLLLLLFPFSAFSQEIPKKATKIIVPYDSTVVSLNKIAKKLYEQGYVVDKKDDENGFLSTQDKSSKKYSASYRIKAMIQDTIVLFTSLMALDVQLDFGGVRSERSYDEVYYAAKGNINREAFLTMDKVVKSFGLPVRYEK